MLLGDRAGVSDRPLVMRDRGAAFNWAITFTETLAETNEGVDGAFFGAQRRSMHFITMLRSVALVTNSLYIASAYKDNIRALWA